MNKQRILEGLLAVAGFASALFLFLPLVVYLLNLDSVATPKMTIMLCGGLLTALSTIILVAGMFIPHLSRWVITFCQIGLITVVVLTVFPNRTGEITGFTAFIPSVQILLAAVKLLAVCVGCTLLAWKKPLVLSTLSHYTLIIVLLVTGYVVFVPLSAADKSVRKQIEIPADFTQLGESNVIVVIFDSFTGYRMLEILNEYPKLRTALDGFVYYPSALASALSTPAGVGAILTGDLRTSMTKPFARDRNADSLQNSFLTNALQSGLSAGFISLLRVKETRIPFIRENEFYEQKRVILVNRFPAYLGFLELSLSRVAPEIFSTITRIVAEKISAQIQKSARTDFELLQSLQSESERRSLSGKMAFNFFVDNLKVTKKAGSVLVLHSMLTHPPNNLTATGKYEVDKGQGYEGTSVYAAHELTRLCAKLRALGVYDNTLIIAVADHGAMKISDITMGGAFPASKRLPLEYNPLLMVKAPHKRGPCYDSTMSVWLGDVATTVRDFLGTPSKELAMVATRSLLQPELAQRILTVPIFFRPDQVSHYDALSKWIRQDFKGTFRDFGAVGAVKPEQLLQSKSQVKLFVGVDKMNMEILKTGWTKDRNIPYRGSIEVNNRLLAKLTSPGIAVVTGTKDAGYQVQIFTDMKAGEAFVNSISPERDRLAVGLQVPSVIARRLSPESFGAASANTPVGIILVSGPSYGPAPKVISGVGDLDLEVRWNPTAMGKY